MRKCPAKELHGSQDGRTPRHVLMRMVQDDVHFRDGRADAFLGCRERHHDHDGKRQGERQGQAIAGQRERIINPTRIASLGSMGEMQSSASDSRRSGTM